MVDAKDLSPKEAQLAAELEADVVVEQIGTVYAKALLGAAEKAGQADALREEFDSLVTDVLGGFPRFEVVLSSTLVSYEEKSGLLDRLLGRQASPMLLNFLKILARRGRLDCLRAVHREYHLLHDQLRRRVPVEVVTAAPISPALLAEITAQLRSVVDGEPVVRHRLQPDLIGGVLVRMGDTVYDGSIANQLENLRQQIIDRSVHEIQSRRDRFRHPA
jgi:F-type H+-transporting ATPase subunit delta